MNKTRSKTYDSPTVREQVSIATPQRPTTKPLETPEDFSWHCIRTLSGHRHIVDSVAISDDGQTLASGSADNTIKLWKKK
jgi:WD40 repeat protein